MSVTTTNTQNASTRYALDLQPVSESNWPGLSDGGDVVFHTDEMRAAVGAPVTAQRKDLQTATSALQSIKPVFGPSEWVQAQNLATACQLVLETVNSYLTEVDANLQNLTNGVVEAAGVYDGTEQGSTTDFNVTQSQFGGGSGSSGTGTQQVSYSGGGGYSGGGDSGGGYSGGDNSGGGSSQPASVGSTSS